VRTSFQKKTSLKSLRLFCLATVSSKRGSRRLVCSCEHGFDHPISGSPFTALDTAGWREFGETCPESIRKDTFHDDLRHRRLGQLLALFVLWAPSGIIWWQAEGTAFVFVCGLYATLWALLMWASFNVGAEVQSGALGWMSLAQNIRTVFFGHADAWIVSCDTPTNLCGFCVDHMDRARVDT
jgi:hypothetical protein